MAEEASQCSGCGVLLEGKDRYEGLCPKCREERVLARPPAARKPHPPAAPPEAAASPAAPGAAPAPRGGEAAAAPGIPDPEPIVLRASAREAGSRGAAPGVPDAAPVVLFPAGAPPAGHAAYPPRPPAVPGPPILRAPGTPLWRIALWVLVGLAGLGAVVVVVALLGPRGGRASAILAAELPAGDALEIVDLDGMEDLQASFQKSGDEEFKFQPQTVGMPREAVKAPQKPRTAAPAYRKGRDTAGTSFPPAKETADKVKSPQATLAELFPKRNRGVLATVYRGPSGDQEAQALFVYQPRSLDERAFQTLLEENGSVLVEERPNPLFRPRGRTDYAVGLKGGRVYSGSLRLVLEALRGRPPVEKSFSGREDVRKLLSELSPAAIQISVTKGNGTSMFSARSDGTVHYMAPTLYGPRRSVQRASWHARQLTRSGDRVSMKDLWYFEEDEKAGEGMDELRINRKDMEADSKRGGALFGKLESLDIARAGSILSVTVAWRKTSEDEESDETKQARAQHLLIRDCNNLNQLARAFAVYLNRFGDNRSYPKGIGELVEKGLITDTKALISPLDSDPPRLPNGTPCSYVSCFDLHPDLQFRDDFPPNVIMAWDRKPFVPGRRGVLFFDSHVELVDEARFQQLMSQLEASVYASARPRGQLEPRKGW